MKARIVKGKIIKYPKLPSNFGNVIGGFENSSTEVLEGYGFYDIITPSYDNKTQYISNLHTIDDYEDVDGKKRTVFIYDVKTKTFSQTLAELKEDKLQELKAKAHTKLQGTDWYVTRKAEKGTAIPDDIETERDNIRALVDTKESEIKALTKKVDVFNYDTTL